MIFVNEIAEIAHGIVDKYSGAPNKNIGDAFLFVWKLEKEDTFTDELGELQPLYNQRVSQLADMSVISFLLLNAGLKKSNKLLKYKNHRGLNERMSNYEVKLGLGLHIGYAIEGAIGSYYKIDASYLSPHVNMSARLEGATKTYGVPILISGVLYKYLSQKTQSHCRQVDFVTMIGNKTPLSLYTIDLDTSGIITEEI